MYSLCLFGMEQQASGEGKSVCFGNWRKHGAKSLSNRYLIDQLINAINMENCDTVYYFSARFVPLCANNEKKCMHLWPLASNVNVCHSACGVSVVNNHFENGQ